MRADRRAFTLIELLVVIIIILAVSVLALPAVLTANRDRAVGDGARLLQASLVGARDAAKNAGSSRDLDKQRSDRLPIGLAGLRFLPDPTIPITRLPSGQIDPSRALVCDRWVRTEIPPEYRAGEVSTWPGTDYSSITPLPCLVLEEQPGRFEPSGTGYAWVATQPTDWWGMIRQGERVKVQKQWFTVCGPMATFNPESFVNATVPWSRTYTAPDGTQQTVRVQYLFLVNGVDDNRDGLADSGWDGLDNDGVNGIDDAGEWEVEAWPPVLGSPRQGMSYLITRRPAPSPGQQSTTLPVSVVIDLTTWGTTGERSHLPVNVYTGTVDLIVEPNGTVRPDIPYGVRSSIGMDASLLHFWLCDRGDVVDPVVTQGSYLTLPIPPALKGARHLVQVQTRSGRITTGPLESFAADPTVPTAPLVPFLPYRQGQ